MNWNERRVRCPSCRGRAVFPAEQARTQQSCPHCGARMLVAGQGMALRKAGWGALSLTVTGLGLTALYLGFQSPASALAPGPIALRAGRAPVPQHQTVPTAPAMAVTGEGMAAVAEPETVRALVAENASIRGQLENLMNWVLDNVRGKYPVPERMVTNLQVAAVNEDYTLSGDVAELLRVTEEERSLVDDALVVTRQNLAAIESEVMQVAEAGPDKVKLYVPPYEKEGQAAREDLYAALETTLGANRFDRFVDVANQSLEEQYNYFGRAARTMTFEVAYPVDQSIPPYLVIRDGWDIPDGPSSHTMQTKESSVYELPPAYLAYLNLMPANVASYARP